jgi:hypothetical protein
MSVYEKLLDVQNELKAPKSQYNKFGNYNYRNCEDILEAAKPICKKHKAVVFLSDKLVMNGERHYIEATATFVDVETNETIIVTAYAREEESKKGMDGSQVTGASSSYARKYALNGLFDVDDTKDSDGNNQDGNQANNGNQKKTTNKAKQEQDVFLEINKAISAYSKQSGMKSKDVVEYIEKQIGEKLDKSLPKAKLKEVLETIKSWSAT